MALAGLILPGAIGSQTEGADGGPFAGLAQLRIVGEIDGALDLMRESIVKSFALVVAAPCVISPTLRGFKRIEGENGVSIPAKEAADRLVRTLLPYAS